MSTTNVDIKINKPDENISKNIHFTTSEHKQVEESKKLEYAKKAYEVKKCKSDYKKHYINTRYDKVRRMMRNPNEMDKHFFKKIVKSIRAHSMGCIWGLLDGALSGWLIGVKFGGHGGWIVGGISQIGSMILAMTVGLVHGAINGAFTNKEEASLLIRDHRYAIGSTQGGEMIKPSLDLFPSYEIPKYITKGDKKNINYY